MVVVRVHGARGVLEHADDVLNHGRTEELPEDLQDGMPTGDLLLLELGALPEYLVELRSALRAREGGGGTGHGGHAEGSGRPAHRFRHLGDHLCAGLGRGQRVELFRLTHPAL